ncbi:MAG: MFS transporter [Oscillospiraceae bacterium]|nr:MFS transporter [Oscillospiraceae bacterium]
MKKHLSDIYEMRHYLLLWSTQMISGLGSGMTAYALVIWSYEQKGSALMTALLMVCTYTPYVLCSIFAGALSDRWNKKKILLLCDGAAMVCTLTVFALLKTDRLQVWHLYLVNAFTGLMNTVQQPASEVATTALLPRKFYQKVGSLRYLSSSVNSIMTPVIATAVLGLAGMDAVILIDLLSFAAAALVLIFFIPIPKIVSGSPKENFLRAAGEGIRYLKKERGILHLMLFLAAINLVASMFEAAFPAMMLSREGGETAMGIVKTVTGLTMLLGSIISSVLPVPKSRVKAIWLCLALSMCTENFLLGFGKSLWVWCVGSFLGWIAIPWMSANLDAIYRLTIPEEIQGRVFAARNSFQFFTIPLGYFIGGFMVDRVFEPVMALQQPGSPLSVFFGSEKGSGAAFFFAVLGVLGVIVCAVFRRDRHIKALEIND